MEPRHRRATDLAELTERELLIDHSVRIETLNTVMQDLRGDLTKHYGRFNSKVDWRICRWFVGLVTVGILCLTGYVSTLSDRIAENAQDIAVYMGVNKWY